MDIVCSRSVHDALVHMVCAVDFWMVRWRTDSSEMHHFTFVQELGDDCNDCHVADSLFFPYMLCLVIEIADNIVLMFSMCLLFLLFAQLPDLALTYHSSAPCVSQISTISTHCEVIVEHIGRSKNHKATRCHSEKPMLL